MRKLNLLFFILVAILVFTIFTFARSVLALNLLALDTVHLSFTGKPLVAEHPAWFDASHLCASNWMQGLQAEISGNLAARDKAYLESMACNPIYVTLLQQKHPTDINLAQLAVANQPDSPDSWFWAGDLLPDRKIEYYQRGLAIDPTDGQRWLTLGQLLENVDSQAALTAYVNSCQNGDPGYHGCAAAGYLAEKLGEYDRAIRYYRLSSYSRIRQFADDLEKKLTPTP